MQTSGLSSTLFSFAMGSGVGKVVAALELDGGMVCAWGDAIGIAVDAIALATPMFDDAETVSGLFLLCLGGRVLARRRRACSTLPSTCSRALCRGWC